MKFAVAITTHTNDKIGIYLDIIEADSIESAMGKFYMAKHVGDVLFGAYRIMNVERNP